MSRFRPTYMFDSVETISFDVLEKENVKGIIFDSDNTLIDYKKELKEEKKKWVTEAKKRGYSICILSNTTSQKRVRDIMTILDVNGLYCATKPFLRGFKMAQVLLDLEKNELIMIGDQIFTDIYGANRFGIKSILVKPISAIEDPFTKIKRFLEGFIIKRIKRQDIKNKK